MNLFCKTAIPFVLLFELFLILQAVSKAQENSKSAPKLVTVKDFAKVLQACEQEVKLPRKQMSFPELLDYLEAQLPAKSRIRIKLDRMAFGKNHKKIVAAKINLADFPDRIVVKTCLRVVVSWLAKEDGTYALHPGSIVVTSKRAKDKYAQYTIVHNLKGLDEALRKLKLRRELALAGIDARNRQFTETAPLLASVIMSKIDPKHWLKQNPLRGIMEVRRSKLRVRTTLERHLEIADFLTNILRLSDLAVAVQPNLFEIGRRDFAKHFPPNFRGVNRRFVVPALLDSIKKQEPWRKGDRVLLLPGEDKLILSFHKAFNRHEKNKGEKKKPRFTTVLDGFALNAKVEIGAYRRRIRIHFTRKRMLDGRPMFDKMRMEVGDGQPLLMATNWQSKKPDKRLIAAMRPIIWIEEEQELIRAEKLPPIPQGLAAKVQKQPRPKPIWKTTQNTQILNAVIKDFVEHKGLLRTRNFFGTMGKQKLLLVSDEKGIAWPKWFSPKIAGWRIEHCAAADLKSRGKRVLGIRLDSFEKLPERGLVSETIVIAVFNAGGHDNGAVLGESFVRYRQFQKKKRWSVRHFGSFDTMPENRRFGIIGSKKLLDPNFPGLGIGLFSERVLDTWE